MTFSILACSDDEIGVATASHWIAVGAMVPWCRVDAGAVATQAFTEPAYGPRCLEAMAAGGSADVALEQALACDPDAALRQVAVIDARGRTASHTGASCLPHTSASTGHGVIAVGNMLAADGVADAMVEAFDGACGCLASRLLEALAAGDGVGGDARGRQAGAVRTVPRHAADPAGLAAREVNLRVDDHPKPIAELQRLLLQASYFRDIAACAFPGSAHANEDLATRGQEPPDITTLRHLCATADGEAATEAALWLAVARLRGGDAEGAEDLLRHHPNLRVLATAAVPLRPR